jgi:UDP-2,4-diacetamido-2,4,6-trideoxy-beta-L-altropyranose hydrolase
MDVQSQAAADGQRMNVVFRVDASVQIGTGHVMRCLTLADELRHQGHQCRFISRDHQGHLGELIASKGFAFDLLSIPEGANIDCWDDGDTAHAHWLGVTWQVDAEQSLAALESVEVDWLVVDHYALDARWEMRLAVVVKNILVIDDLADRSHECDLLLDQNLGRQEADYNQRVPAYCRRLIGPRYALLRAEFAKLREVSRQRRLKPQLKRILISLGGVDATNITGRVLNALAESDLPVETELDIVMGASAPYLEEVRRQAVRLPFRTTVSVDVTDMAERMYSADLSIGAAGSTSWERCCLGLPTVLVILADNQVSGARALHTWGAAIAIDHTTEALETDLSASLIVLSGSKALQRMSNAAAEVTVGDGVGRVVDALAEVAGDMNE